MSEAVAMREDFAPAVPTIVDKLAARILEIGGSVQEIGECLPDFPLRHMFTPGLYSREITMPAGSFVVSRIHKTEHPFVVSKGSCSVLTADGSAFEHYSAPHFGITKPGTCRFLVIHTETVWTTFHVTDTTDIAELERELLVEYENPLIEGGE